MRLSGIMEKKMETTIILGLYRVIMGIMEKKMEATIIVKTLSSSCYFSSYPCYCC